MSSNYDQYKNKLKSFVEKDKIEFEQFLDDYKSKLPEPIKNITWPNIKFWLALVGGLSAVAVSGFRIYDRFFSVASKSGATDQLSVAEAIAGVGAVNIVLLALSFARAYNNKKMSEESLTWGLIVAGGISAVAGLGQSFHGLGIESITGFFDLILAFTLAAVTLLEWLMGDLLGVEYNHFIEDKTQNNKSYEDEYKKWYTTARQQFGAWKARFMAWDEKQQKIEKIDESSRENDEQINKQKNVNKNPREYTKAAEIVYLIKKVYEEQNQLPTVTQIVKMLAEQKVQQKEINVADMGKFISDKKGSVSQQIKRWSEKNIDVKTKYYIKKFIKDHKEIPSINEISKYLNISNDDATLYLSEFIIGNQVELLKYKIIGKEDIDDAVKIVNQ